MVRATPCPLYLRHKEPIPIVTDAGRPYPTAEQRSSARCQWPSCKGKRVWYSAQRSAGSSRPESNNRPAASDQQWESGQPPEYTVQRPAAIGHRPKAGSLPTGSVHWPVAGRPVGRGQFTAAIVHQRAVSNRTDGQRSATDKWRAISNWPSANEQRLAESSERPFVRAPSCQRPTAGKLYQTPLDSDEVFAVCEIGSE